MSTINAPGLTEADVVALLERRYPPPRYVVLPQVRALIPGLRIADAIVVDTQQPDAFGLQGFEIKTSRLDWIKERSSPDKASFRRYCHRWWYAADSDRTLPREELPAGSGLLVVAGGARKRLQVVVGAPTLLPEPLTLSVIAGVIKQARSLGP